MRDSPRFDGVFMGNASANPIYVAAIIERADNHLLIVLPSDVDATPRRWAFPCGLAGAKETPETALRRMTEQTLGVKVEIVMGQPPVVAAVAGKAAQIRYFFCSVVSGEPAPGPYADVRWIPKAHLCEYDFDTASTPVANWLMES